MKSIYKPAVCCLTGEFLVGTDRTPTVASKLNSSL